MHQSTEVYTNFFKCVCVDFFSSFIDHMLSKSEISVQYSSVNLKSFKQQLNFIVMHSKTHIESTNISYNRQNIRQYVKNYMH